MSGTAILVSLIGFTALHLSRLDLRKAVAQNDRVYARQLAYSGVEFALAAIDRDTSWRTNYAHGVENAVSPYGLGGNLVFKFLDNADSDLANDTTQPLEIQGIGRSGGATFVYRVDYAPSVTSSEQVGPLDLRSFTNGNNNTGTSVGSSAWLGQYFLPNLPAEAVSWTVTKVDVSLKISGSASGTLNVNLHLPNGTLLPSTLLETNAVLESQMSSSYSWQEIHFSNMSGLDPNVGLCLTLTTNDGNAGSVKYEGSGVTEPNAHMFTGNASSWSSPITNQSLYYKISGVYATATGSGTFAITPGSWQTAAAP
ncbi:MAG: hypothetical protein GXP24_13180 [Planctomycetes bacterium]|nr:hypothetical protein [Planctomycetota bacterium]